MLVGARLIDVAMERSHEPHDSQSSDDVTHTSMTTGPQERLCKLSCIVWDKQTPSPAWLVTFAENKGVFVSLQHRASMAFVGVHGATVFLSEKLCFKEAARFSLCKLPAGPFAGLLRFWHALGGFLSLAPSGDIVIAVERAEAAIETLLLNSLWRLERYGEAVVLRNMWSGGLLSPA